MKIAHTYKELMAIAGLWPTVHIRNNYKIGSDHFTMSYNGDTVLYQNDDIKNVAGCASCYNGLSGREYRQFDPNDYK